MSTRDLQRQSLTILRAFLQVSETPRQFPGVYCRYLSLSSMSPMAMEIGMTPVTAFPTYSQLQLPLTNHL